MSGSTRGLLVKVVDGALARTGGTGTQRYIDMVGRLPVGHRLSSRVRQVLLNLPTTGDFTVEVTADDHRFLYRAQPDDTFNLSCRMNFSEYEPATRKVFSRLSRHSDVVVDAGAYSGLYSLTAAASNPTCHVIAFEPNPQTFRLLEGNVAANKYGDRIQLHRVGLSDQVGSLPLFSDDRDGASTMASLILGSSERAVATVVVPVTPLDRIPECRIADLIKIDVEGAEIQVLRGATETLSSNQPYLLTEALSEAQLAEQTDLLSTFGYASPSVIRPSHESDRRNFVWIHPRRQAEASTVLAGLLLD